MNEVTKIKAPRKPRTKKVKAVALSPLGAFNQALAELVGAGCVHAPLG